MNVFEILHRVDLVRTEFWEEYIAICLFETSVLTRATRYNISKDILHCYSRETSQTTVFSVLQTMTVH
jgi:hypothetical protein